MGRCELPRAALFHLHSCCRRGESPPSTYDPLFRPGWLDANNNNNSNNSNTAETKPEQRIKGGFTIHSNSVCTHSSECTATCKYVTVTSSWCELRNWVRRHGQIPLPSPFLPTPTFVMPPQDFPFVSPFFIPTSYPSPVPSLWVYARHETRKALPFNSTRNYRCQSHLSYCTEIKWYYTSRTGTSTHSVREIAVSVGHIQLQPLHCQCLPLYRVEWFVWRLNWEEVVSGAPVPRIYIPQEQGGPVIPPGTGIPFVASYDSQGLRWRYSNPPPHGV
jgi:hypothetical protein